MATIISERDWQTILGSAQGTFTVTDTTPDRPLHSPQACCLYISGLSGEIRQLAEELQAQGGQVDADQWEVLDESRRSLGRLLGRLRRLIECQS